MDSRPRPIRRRGRFDFNRPQVLLLARASEGVEWHRLCEELGVDPTSDRSEAMHLLVMLEELRYAELISFDYDRRRRIKGPIRTTSKWQQVQSALNVSLVELAALSNRDAMIVEPAFRSARRSESLIDLFVLMPFAPELKPIFDDHILNVAQSLGLRAVRADDLFTTGSVVFDIWRSIISSRVIVADCTGRNPNVFYELGMAHTIGKPVILITQDSNDVPFDIRHLRHIAYDYTPRGMKILEEQLKKTLQGLLPGT
jgi:hypothetical protein